MSLALVLAVIGGLGLLWGWRKQRPALCLLSAVVIVSHAWPLATLDPALASPTLQAQLGPATAIATLASFSWYAGYWLMIRPMGERAAPSDTPPHPAPRRLHLATLLCLAGLVAAMPGGPLGFAQAGFLRLPVESFLFSLTYAVACLAAFTTSLSCVAAAAGRTAPPWFSMAIVLLVFWLSGGRVQFLITGIGFCLIFLAHGRMRLRGLVLPALAGAVLAGFTLDFRLTLQGQAVGLIEAFRLTLEQLSLLDSYALAARFAQETGYQASHYWDVLQQILPRALFPEKPPQLSRQLRLMEARDMLGGLTPGLAGEAFATGGLICVSAVGIAFGGTLALLDATFRRLTMLPGLVQALVACLIPLLAIFALRGGFDTAIFRLVILLAVAACFGLHRPVHRLRLRETIP